MILIADSGSSKTDWSVLHADRKISQHRGVGFNPYYQTALEMAVEMKDQFLVNLGSDIQAVYFYGAGCSKEDKVSQVKDALSEVFQNAQIHVDHDLEAAARATCGHQAGIACILGTGSNSCDFDGKQIIATRPAPGFILGDEGGGGYIGKKLLMDFIHDEMPLDIKKEMIDRFQLDVATILDNVYRKPFPNRYMASFCPFVSELKSDSYCYLLFYNAFQDFFNKHIFKYQDFAKKPVNFVGSIAYFNSDILRKAASDSGIHVNIIIETPIAGLTLYHQNLL